MPAMLFAGMPYRGHEPGRPRRSYKTGTVPQSLRVGDSNSIL